jgi:hypothetical protein
MMTNLFNPHQKNPSRVNTPNRRHQKMKPQILSAIGFATSLYALIFLGMFI